MLYMLLKMKLKILRFINKGMTIADCWAMAHPAANSHLPGCVEVEPSLICYKMTNKCVPIKNANFSGSTVRQGLSLVKLLVSSSMQK